jgi:hypothetical protein
VTEVLLPIEAAGIELPLIAAAAVQAAVRSVQSRLCEDPLTGRQLHA